MTNKIALSLTTCLLGTSLLSTPYLVKAEQITQSVPKNCQLLKEIQSGQTSIRKEIENPANLDIKVFENNWNTDFAVPTGTKFQSFTASLTPENEAVYDVSINLKYNDDTTITVYDKETAMNRGKTYSFPFESPNNRQPYQVNLKVKGDNNNAYSASVMACR